MQYSYAHVKFLINSKSNEGTIVKQLNEQKKKKILHIENSREIFTGNGAILSRKNEKY